MRFVPSYVPVDDDKLMVMAIKREKTKIPVVVDILGDDKTQYQFIGIQIKMALTARQYLSNSDIFESYSSVRFLFEPENVIRLIDSNCKELPGTLIMNGDEIPIMLYADGADISIQLRGDENDISLKFQGGFTMHLLQDHEGENYVSDMMITP